MIANGGIWPAGSGPRDGPCYCQVFQGQRAVYRSAGVPKVSGVGNAFGFVGLLLQAPSARLRFAFSIPGGAFCWVFRLAFAIKGDAYELASVFDSTLKIGTPLAHDEGKRITFPSALEIAAGALLWSRNDNPEGTLGAPPQFPSIPSIWGSKQGFCQVGDG